MVKKCSLFQTQKLLRQIYKIIEILVKNWEIVFCSFHYFPVLMLIYNKKIKTTLLAKLLYQHKAMLRKGASLLTVFSIWKLLQVLQKAGIDIVADANYTYIFFLIRRLSSSAGR